MRRCHYHVRDPEAARDLSQEVWIRVMTKFHQFRQEATFTSWLFGIAHHRCHDHLKKDKQRLHQEISRKIIDSLADSLDAEEADQLTVEILGELMEKISGQDKLLLLLKHEQDWSIRTIAQSLNMKEDNVKKHLSRSRQKVQKLLAEQR